MDAEEVIDCSGGGGGAALPFPAPRISPLVRKVPAGGERRNEDGPRREPQKESEFIFLVIEGGTACRCSLEGARRFAANKRPREDQLSASSPANAFPPTA